MLVYLSTISAAQVSALAACIGVVVTMIFHGRNLKATRLSNSAKMVSEFYQRWRSDEMRVNRASFATLLLRSRGAIDLRRDCPVAEFVEELGYLTRRKVLDQEMVWSAFSWSLEPYY